MDPRLTPIVHSGGESIIAIVGSPDINIADGDTYTTEGGNANRAAIYLGASFAEDAVTPDVETDYNGVTYDAVAMSLDVQANFFFSLFRSNASCIARMMEASLPGGAAIIVPTWNNQENLLVEQGVMLTLKDVNQSTPVVATDFDEQGGTNNLSLSAGVEKNGISLISVCSSTFPNLPTGYTTIVIDTFGGTTERGIFFKLIDADGTENVTITFASAGTKSGCILSLRSA